jgi:protein-tyrosine-phosphatase/ubiquinone/menaquinone biosynthesis C-methylase UbiE
MRVLFACVGNAGRSQMAQAFFERAGGEGRSAGTRPSPEVHPNVVEAMLEVGIDLSGRTPRKLELGDAEWADLVITMGCGDECPVVPGREYRDWPLEDPIGKSIEETRPIRDEIERRVARLVADLAVERSGYLRECFAEGYDAFRPRPPQALLDLLCRYADVERPRLVVDLGSGTGLSAEVWAARAELVVGVEPNAEMRRVAEAGAPANVRYLDTVSSDTGQAPASADVVTAAQSLHWMEPGSTLAEVARILRPGGAFAAYDYEWPPAVHPEVDAAFERLLEVDFWPSHPNPKKDHLKRMRESCYFRFARQVELHSVEEGDVARVMGLAASLGPLASLSGSAEYDAALGELGATAEKTLGGRRVPFVFSYRVRLAVGQRV